MYENSNRSIPIWLSSHFPQRYKFNHIFERAIDIFKSLSIFYLSNMNKRNIMTLYQVGGLRSILHMATNSEHVRNFYGLLIQSTQLMFKCVIKNRDEVVEVK